MDVRDRQDRDDERDEARKQRRMSTPVGAAARRVVEAGGWAAQACPRILISHMVHALVEGALTALEPY